MLVLEVILWCTFIVSLYYVLSVLKNWIRIAYLCSLIPGPGNFLLGSLYELLCDEATSFKTMRKWSQNYGPIYVFSATFLFPCANISGASELEKVISSTKHMEKGDIYNFLSRWLGEGLLTSTDEKWHVRRKILTPAFHFSILQQFVAIFNKETKRLVDVFKKDAEKPWTNVIPSISQFTLMSITETSMGVSLDLENKEDKSYVAAIGQLGKIVSFRAARPWTYNNFIYYNFIPTGWKECQLLKTLHSFTDNIVSLKCRYFKNIDASDKENFNYSLKKKLAFLDLLLQRKFADGSIDDEGIKDEVNTFLFEGHDTTSSSICFTLMLLANHRDFQDDIYKEIITVLGDSKFDPDLNDLNELKLMERFIKESLRLYPSVPFIARKLEEETMVNGYLVPMGIDVNIHIYDIHRNPKYWKDPEKFDPDRFLPKNCVGRHPYAYVPFSAGPRNCIGQRFAMLEIKAVLCGILRNFILEPIDTPETIEILVDIILRNKSKSIKVKFRRRDF